MATLSDTQKDFLRGKNFAVVATVSEDGSPQSTVVWVDTDGENVVFNTKRGRAKVEHLERDPRISVTVIDSENPYSFLEVRASPRSTTRVRTSTSTCSPTSTAGQISPISRVA